MHKNFTAIFLYFRVEMFFQFIIALINTEFFERTQASCDRCCIRRCWKWEQTKYKLILIKYEIPFFFLFSYVYTSNQKNMSK